MLNQDKLARPYTFDLDLDIEGQEIDRKLEDRRHRNDALDTPPILVTEEEALNWKQQGYESGYEIGSKDGHKAGFDEGRAQGQDEGRAQALESIEKRISDQLDVLSQKLDEGRSQFGDLDRRFEMSAITVAIKLLHLFAPVAARNNALDEIEGVIDQTLRDLIHEPKLIIKVTESVRQPLSERIDTLIATHGFDGKITVLADEALVNADLVIQWEDGGIERTESNIWNTLNEGIEQLLGVAPVGSSDIDETVKSLVADMEPDANLAKNMPEHDSEHDFANVANASQSPETSGSEVSGPETSEPELSEPETSEPELSAVERPKPEEPEMGATDLPPSSVEQGPVEPSPNGEEAQHGSEQLPPPQDVATPVSNAPALEQSSNHQIAAPADIPIDVDAPSSQAQPVESFGNTVEASQEAPIEESDWMTSGASAVTNEEGLQEGAITADQKRDDQEVGLHTLQTPASGASALKETDLEDWTDAADWDQN